MTPHFLAFDLGAESGRAVVGSLYRRRLYLKEVHRFANEPVEAAGTHYWDILSLYREMLKAMQICASRYGRNLDGIGIDSWGVDFGLLARDGSLVQNPVHYRDSRTEGIEKEVLSRMAAAEIHANTGMALSRIQTACQLLAMRLRGSPALDVADCLLMIPDLLAYFLTGEKRCERTNAISTQLYRAKTGAWWEEMFRALDLPVALMPALASPGHPTGTLAESIQKATGLGTVPVFFPCTHDTASAVAAVPGSGSGWAFISSGTWSVVGALSEGLIPEACAAGLCNELTLDGFFLCRNVMGLWLLQQARREWRLQGVEYSYEALMHLAEECPPGTSVIDVDDAGFLSPASMGEAIREFCRGTEQVPPESPGAVTRSILQSLALAYRKAIDETAGFQGRRFEVIHVVGGGSRNTLLCQFTADATGLPVIAGPAEATVAGNVLVQALAAGVLGSAKEVREVVRRSSVLVEFSPRDTARWDELYGRYRSFSH